MNTGLPQLQQLRATSLRITTHRATVPDVLTDQPPSTARTINRHVDQRLGSVSTRAICNVSAALTDAGQPAGTAALFELRGADNHHHLVYRRCGVLADVDWTVRQSPCLTPSPTRGLCIEKAEPIFWGTCPTCSQKPESSPSIAEETQ